MVAANIEDCQRLVAVVEVELLVFRTEFAPSELMAEVVREVSATK